MRIIGEKADATVVRMPADHEDPLNAATDQISEPKCKALIITGLERGLESQDQEIRGGAWCCLNAGRDAWKNHFSMPILFMMTPEIHLNSLKFAPDLFSRMTAHRFDDEKE